MRDFHIVTAVYNSERYLDRFFASILVEQNYDPNRLTIIAVDDGSIDGSLNKLHDWKNAYPDSIRILTKANGGPASARNMGLRQLEQGWVTFIDSDDFVDRNYFKSVDAFLDQHPDAELACCQNYAFREATGKTANSHFLKYRFASGDRVFSIDDPELFPHHSASTAFFKTSRIKEGEIEFPEDLRIGLEDSLFIAKYLLVMKLAHCGEVGFVSNARYYARRRAEATSVTGNSLQKPEYYIELLEFGSLKMLELYRKAIGEVPRNIQLTILYDLVWRIRDEVDGPASVDCLSPFQNEKYKSLLADIFDFIDPETIENASGSVYWFFYKAGLLNLFKPLYMPRHQYCYINYVDICNKQIELFAYTPHILLALDGRDIVPTETKRLRHTFLGNTFIDEYCFRFSYQSLSETISLRYRGDGEVKCDLKLHKTNFNHRTVGSLVKAWTKVWAKYPQRSDIWLISDSFSFADDNGEHFYRYLASKKRKNKIYYVLEKNSPDWIRLKQEGFNLVEYRSKRYYRLLKRASTLISSQLDPGMMNQWRDWYGYSKRLVFLQHGVTKDDISSYLNGWKVNVVCSSVDEHRSIVEDGSPYRFFPENVGLLGFPRHDRLLQIDQEIPTEKCILVSPTWRRNLVSGIRAGETSRHLLDGFEKSTYHQQWSAFLNSAAIKELVLDAGWKVVLAPHPNMRECIDSGVLPLPRYIEIAPRGVSYQTLFSKASIMVTDYSSTAFEMAYLFKPTLYFQFDRKEFFSHHTYKQGYFDYEKDGFGPVSETLESAESSLIELCGNPNVSQPYRDRMEKTFPFRDGRCAERILSWIEGMPNQWRVWNSVFR